MTLRSCLSVLILLGCDSGPGSDIDAGSDDVDGGDTVDSGAPLMDAARDAPSGRLDAGASTSELLFFDDFDYVVGRDGDTNAVETFMAEGGWTGVKTAQDTDRNPRGYLYTTDAVPGIDGPLPTGPGRALVMEALPLTLGTQTDFYLQLGQGDGPADAIPGDVWFQFWIDVARTDDQPSGFTGGKFLYPCNGPYPCNSQRWLVVAGPSSRTPHWELPFGTPTEGDFFINNIATIEGAEFNQALDPDNYWKMGQTDTSEWVATNRWTLVKIHIDTSTPAGRFEMWMRAMGADWTKTADWVDGSSPTGFVWRLDPSSVGGHRVLRMPTTIGEAVEGRENRDVWIYLDDFAMATGEDALPTYGDAP